MKAITLLAAMIVTLTSCNCQKKAAEKGNVSSMESVGSNATDNQEKQMPVIEYEANTRGFFLKIRVENQKAYISRDRDAEKTIDATAISNADWKEIQTLAKAVNLEKVKDLKWPTEQRFHDGAAHANITFSVGSTNYIGNGFDHGHPPAEIEKLVNKIVALAGNNE
jgi:hypothetical protein